jgi:protease-4
VKPAYHRLSTEPWFITEPGMVQFASRFSYDVPPGALTAKSDPETVTSIFGDVLLKTEMISGVGVVTISGVMISGAGRWENLFGGIGHAQIMGALARVEAMKPAAVALVVNSPGGTCSATPELSDYCAAMATRLPMVVFCEAGIVASAALWFAATADGLYGTTSSQWGSVGCVCQIESQTEALKAQGVDVRVISSSPKKALGHSSMPITAETETHFQEVVNQLGAQFTQSVRASRPGVSEEAFNGQCFFAADAVRLGLIDAVVSSLDEVISIAKQSSVKQSTSSQSSRSAAPSAVNSKMTREQAAEALAEKSISSGGVRIFGRTSERYTMEDFKNGKLR